MEISIRPSPAARAPRWSRRSEGRVASRLRWGFLIPIAALGFAAPAATIHPSPHVAPPASFLGPPLPTTSELPKELRATNPTGVLRRENEPVATNQH